MAQPTPEQRQERDVETKPEYRVASIFYMSSLYAENDEFLPDDLVRILRFLLRGYPPEFGG